MKASDYIAKFLEAKKIDFVFELSGGMITKTDEALGPKPGFQVLLQLNHSS